MLFLPVWLLGPMLLLGVSVSGLMFFLGVFVQGSLSRGLCSEGSLPRGSLSRVSLSRNLCPEGVSVQGISVQEGLYQGNPQAETPYMVKSRWYASYCCNVTGSRLLSYLKNTWLRTMCCLQIIWWENRKSQQRSWSAAVPHGEDVVQTGCD